MFELQLSPPTPLSGGRRKNARAWRRGKRRGPQSLGADPPQKQMHNWAPVHPLQETPRVSWPAHRRHLDTDATKHTCVNEDEGRGAEPQDRGMGPVEEQRSFVRVSQGSRVPFSRGNIPVRPIFFSHVSMLAEKKHTRVFIYRFPVLIFL